MMSIPVKLEIINGKKKTTLEVEIRKFSKEEHKERAAIQKTYKTLSSSLTKKNAKLESVQKRRDYSEKLEKFNDALEFQEKMDSLTSELDVLIEEVEAIGGDDFFEKTAQETYEILVSGKDKEKLAEIADVATYGYINDKLNEARVEAEGK